MRRKILPFNKHLEEATKSLLAMPDEELQALLAISAKHLEEDKVFADFLMQNHNAVRPMTVGEIIRDLKTRLEIKDAQIELGLQDFDLNNYWEIEITELCSTPLYKTLISTYIILDDLLKIRPAQQCKEIYNYPAFDVYREAKSLKDLVVSNKYGEEELLNMAKLAITAWKNAKF